MLAMFFVGVFFLFCKSVVIFNWQFLPWDFLSTHPLNHCS